MRFESWVLSAAGVCLLLVAFFNGEELEYHSFGEMHQGLLAEQVIELVKRKPICERECSEGIYTSYIGDYGAALGYVLIQEQKANNPGRVPVLRGLLDDLDTFTDAYATFLAGTSWVNQQGDYVNNQILLRQVVEGLDAPSRAPGSIMTPQVDYLGWRLEGMHRQFNASELEHKDTVDYEFYEIENFNRRKRPVIAAWYPLAARLKRLPRPVALRIVRYLEYRMNIGYDCHYQDNWKSGVTVW